MFAKFVSVDGTPIHYFHTGPSTLPDVPPALAEGGLLLFVHGAGSNAHTWHRQLSHFEGRHAAVALDFPGHGRSGSLEGLPDLAAHVRCLAGFAGALGLRPAVLVGRGLGGAVAVAFATQHPARVRALVLVGTPRRFEVSQESLDTWRAVTQGRATQPFSPAIFSPATDPTVMRECFLEQVKTDPRVRYSDLMIASGLDLTAPLGAVSVPALVVAGRDDRFAPPESAEDVQRHLAGAQLAIIDGAGHMLTSEQPDAFHAVVDGFLAGLPQ